MTHPQADHNDNPVLWRSSSQVISSLDTGVDYYVRVSARNSLGYGATQSSSPTYQHPYEEPTAPTDVALGVTSDTMLTVSAHHMLRN